MPCVLFRGKTGLQIFFPATELPFSLAGNNTMIGNQYFVEMPFCWNLILYITHPYFWKTLRLKAKCLDTAVCGKSALIHKNYVYTSVILKVQIADLGLWCSLCVSLTLHSRPCIRMWNSCPGSCQDAVLPGAGLELLLGLGPLWNN